MHVSGMLVAVIVLLSLLIACGTDDGLPQAPWPPGALIPVADVLGRATEPAVGYADPGGKFELDSSTISRRPGDTKSITLTVKKQDVIYRYGYFYKNGAWSRFTFSGEQIKKLEWINGQATALLSVVDFAPGDNWMVAYGCKDKGTKDARNKIIWECNNGKWMLQKLVLTENVPPEPGVPDEVKGYGDAGAVISLAPTDVVVTRDEPAVLTVTGTGDYVYSRGYVFRNKKLESFELKGQNSGQWLLGKGEAQVSVAAGEFAPGKNAVWVYSCTALTDGWNCHDGKWLVQYFTLKEGVPPAPKKPDEQGTITSDQLLFEPAAPVVKHGASVDVRVKVSGFDASFKQGYVLSGGQWVPFELTGDLIDAEWLRGPVAGTVTLSAGEHKVAVFACSRTNKAWDCTQWLSRVLVVTEESPSIATDGVVASTTTVDMTDTGFPAITSVKVGDIVAFVNKGTKSRWPASNVHPTHTLYPGSGITKCGSADQANIFDACDEIQPGQSYTFTFKKAGSWAYHDHIDPSASGKIVVT